MYRRQPVFQAADPAIVSSGLRPDSHPLQSPLWVRGDNVRFYSGRVERLVPPSTIIAAGGAGRGLSQHQDSTGTRWIWFANVAGQVKRWYGPAAELIDTVTMQAHHSSGKNTSMVDFTHYGDWTIINSGEETAQIYKPGTGLAPYAAALGNVLQFQKILSFVMAVGFEGKSYGWSDSTDIEDFDFGSTENLAGRAPIEDFDTHIRAASRLGSFISVYAEDQMALISFIGVPAIFTHQVVLNGIGAVGKAAVCSDGRANYGVGRNGIWRTDGQSFQYIDRMGLQKYLQRNVNWDQASKIVAAKNDVTGCIEFHFPMAAAQENTEGWCFDPETGGWSKLPPMLSMAERSLFKKPLGITAANNLVLLDDNPAIAGALVLETKPFMLASPHIAGVIDEADFLLNAATEVEFRIGVSELTDKFNDWSNWQTLNTDTRTYRLDLRVSGTYHKLQFRSKADNWDLDLQGFLLYGQVEGSRRDRA